MKQVVEFLTLLHENNDKARFDSHKAVSYTHHRAHETEADIECRLLL